MMGAEPSIRRVWPSSLLARSAGAVLWRHNSARKDAMYVPTTAHCPHISVQVQTTICVHSAAWSFYDYLCMLVMMSWQHSPPSPGYVTTDRTVFPVFPGGDISSAPNW